MSEPGSELIAELWATQPFASSSILCYPEGRAAISAARHAKRLTTSGYRQALEDFESSLRELHLLGVDLALTRRAGELADELGLRGYDSVHLASSLSFGVDAVVTWDRRLSRAALQCGLAVVPAVDPAG